jgi:LysR family transcriptional regulator, glycine cleavage system transcriptional activator
MSRRMPPLNSLKAFEAAARHLSFTRAAGELNVTQAAISHQVKALEETLGLALFRRVNRSLLLTDEGQSLYPDLGDAFDTIAAAVERLYERDQAGVLNLSTLDSIAAAWLVPRIGKFRALHPDIDVRISTTDQVIDFLSDGIDMALRYGTGPYPGMEKVLLMNETLFPVVSPSLIEKFGSLDKPADLVRFPLLHDDMRDDWGVWMEAAGVSGIDVSRGLSFTHSVHVQQAAVAGEGVALGRSVLTADDLSAGLLIKPFDIDLTAHHSYFAVYPKANAHRPKIVAFRDWLVDEAKETQARFASVVGRSNK